MSESERDASELIMDGVRAALGQRPEFTPSTIITQCVVLVRTYTEDEHGKHYLPYRLYPLGELDPSWERGILGDALDASREESRVDSQVERRQAS